MYMHISQNTFDVKIIASAFISSGRSAAPSHSTIFRHPGLGALDLGIE